MKTVIRIGEVYDSRERQREANLSTFATAVLAQDFGRLRDKLKEAIMVLERDEAGRQVFITVGANPPELLVGDRVVHAVFAPPESQEPVATFFDSVAAKGWAEAQPIPFQVREIDANDRIGVRPCVAVVLRRNNQALYCRLRKNKEWTIPEGTLEVGESADSAVRRALKGQLGLHEIGSVMIPNRVPYVNTYIPEAGHFLCLVLLTEYAGAAEPELTEQGKQLYDAIEWGPAAEPPRPTFVTVQAIKRVLEITEPPVGPATPIVSKKKLPPPKKKKKRR